MRGITYIIEGKEMNEYRVHEFAEFFPMLSEEKMAELVEDIKTNGQLFPIVIHGDVIIDGRNRLEACRIAGVQPFFEEYDGGESVENYILSVNVNRRHLNKGQQAMAFAKANPEKGRGKTPNNLEFHNEYVRQARTVLKHAPELVEQVMRDKSDDPMPLSAAYAAAKEVKDIKENIEESDKLDELRKEAPEIADLVQEGGLSMAAGIAELTDIREKKRKQRIATFTAMQKSQMYLDGIVTNPETSLQDMDGCIDEFMEVVEMQPSEYMAALQQTIRKASAFIKYLEKIEWEK